MKISKPSSRNPWFWVPSLYYAEGIPYVMVMTVTVAFYKRMNVSNAELALFTSLLYFPWTLKPLWSPTIDIFKTKRFWIIVMQLIVTAGLILVGISTTASNFFLYTMIFFSLVAICSATHDIAADGFYMLGLDENQQAFFVGIRSTFYRLAMITSGLVVMLAGYFETTVSSIPMAWHLTFMIVAALFFLLFIYHTFIIPYPDSDTSRTIKGKGYFKEFINIYKLFFKKKDIGLIIAFLLIYRLGEAQIVKMSQPFLFDPRSAGGLELTTSQVGFAYSTVGVIALLIGGVLGGVAVARDGLRSWIWWMFAAINIPHVLYIYLSFFQPQSFTLITLCVAGEQFGYGFGFTAYMLYMIYVSQGEYKTSHYALCTGFMALSMMIPGAVSGIIEELLGYKLFFVWVFITMIPGYFVLKALPIELEFGKKNKDIKKTEAVKET
jgi:PAT family beta-lactamase induction signal transducer AmpG